jgi:adenosylmethionine-8-amino-7-oxononanoate aminotransferase
VFEEERTLERLQPKIALLHNLLERDVAPLPAVAEVRARGFMVGIELSGFRWTNAWATRSRSPLAGAARSSARSAT